MKKSVSLHSAELEKIRKEVSKAVVGQEQVLNSVLRGLLCDGHVLLEGVPGIAKTLLLTTLAKTVDCDFNRIQFTPDLLPSDLIGLTTYSKEKGFEVVKGPVFTNFVLADEINRAPPKVQSALLESMQERQVSIGRKTFTLDRPFLVMATQNPIESLGTYPLPQAQIDRFLFKVNMGYPTAEEEKQIVDQNITIRKMEDFAVRKVLSKQKVLEMQEDTKKVYASPEVKEYIVRIVEATRDPRKYGIRNGKYIEYGASPRASIGLYIASKAEAILKGSSFVTPQFVKTVAVDVMRHRLLLNYEGQAEGVKTEDIIAEVLSRVPVK